VSRASLKLSAPREHEDSVLAGLAWIAPWIVGVVAFLLVPLVLSGYYAMTEYPILEKPVFLGFENFSRMFRDELFWKVLANTVVYSLIVVPLSSGLALGLAVLLHRQPPGWKIFRAVLFLPTLSPAAAAAMAWLWLLNPDLGVLNRMLDPILRSFGGTAPRWLQTPAWAFASMVLVALWQVGQSVVIYHAALRDVPASLLEAADLDGMSAWRRFRHVTLPMISPVVLYNMIVSIIGTAQVFVFPYIMTNGGPGSATRFYSMELYDNAFLFGPQMGYACALAWVQVVLLGAVTLLVFRCSRRFVYYRGG
jgi:multiple sugar transport system permease protein